MDRTETGRDAFDALRRDCIRSGKELTHDRFEWASRYLAHELGTLRDAEAEAVFDYLLKRDLRFAVGWSLVPPDWGIELRRDRNGKVTAAVTAPCQDQSVTVVTSDEGAAILAGLATAVMAGPGEQSCELNDVSSRAS